MNTAPRGARRNARLVSTRSGDLRRRRAQHRSRNAYGPRDHRGPQNFRCGQGLAAAILFVFNLDVVVFELVIPVDNGQIVVFILVFIVLVVVVLEVFVDFNAILVNDDYGGLVLDFFLFLVFVLIIFVVEIVLVFVVEIVLVLVFILVFVLVILVAGCGFGRSGVSAFAAAAACFGLAGSAVTTRTVLHFGQVGGLLPRS